MPSSFTQSLLRLRHRLLKGTRLPIALGLVTTLFVHLLSISDNRFIQGLLARLDFIVYDQRFHLLPGALRSNEHNIVIVDYDQRSLQAEGQWPWSRFKLADLVGRLSELGVVVVGFDVFFPEYERNLLQEFNQRVAADTDVSASAQPLLEQLQPFESLLDADAAFAAAMRNTEVVLGFSFRSGENIRSGVLPMPLFSIDAEDRSAISLQQMQGYIGNVDILQQSASGGGFFDTLPDLDGVIRSYNLVLQYDDDIYPSLALEMARLYNVVDDFSAIVESDLQGSSRELTGISMGTVRIPTDPAGRVRVPYLGPQGSFPYISATDVLRGALSDAEKQLLEGSLVLIGTTSTGLYDLRATPVQAVYPGVEIHANVLNAILSSAPAVSIDSTGQQPNSQAVVSVLDAAKASPFPSRPDWVLGATTALMLVTGITLSLVAPLLGPGLLTLLGVIGVVAMVTLNFLMWSRYNLDFPLVLPLLLVILISVGNLAYGFVVERRTKRAIKGMFDQYVPPAHIDAMLDDPDKYDFSGESREMSVLFSDIRNFTTLSEKLSATELKSLLNDFFTPVTSVIFDHNGTIDKYVGDMVMAFWGAPLSDTRHSRNAVNAALAMLKKVAELQPQFRQRGLPEIAIGIGINSGMMNVGDMGSTYRRAYTVIGDEVNLGSRLEGLTKTYGVDLLIGENTYNALDDVLCRQIDKVQVKGKELPIRIYQPVCLRSEASPELLAQVARYHAACEQYLLQRWDDAEAAFGELSRQQPDCLLYRIYLDRITLLRTQILPADWDGTWRHTSK